MEQNDVNNTNCCIFAVEMYEDSMKRLPKIKEETFKQNPFSQELDIPVTKITSDIEYEDVEGILVNKTLYMEKTQKVSLYLHENSGNNVAALSDKAQRLYLHILYTLKKGKDYYQFNKEYYMKRNEIKSETTVSNAITELCRYQYICKSHQRTVYWINPHRFFCGNRVKKYENRIRVVQEWDKTI